MQIGASSDNQNSNGSASAGGWGMAPSSQNGASLPGSLAQSQAGTTPSNNSLGQQSGPTSLPSSQANPFGTNSMPWPNNKPFGIRDFPQTSDSSWSSIPSSVISSSSNKEGNSSIAGALSDPGKMDLAAGLANLGIDKTTPPPDMNWNAMKVWNSSMDPSKLPEGAVGNPADLSFAQATQKGLKPMLSSMPVGVLSAKEEEIRRAIDTHEGWGTRPIRQDTSWDIESSPKASRKVSAENPDMAASNVWNNNNGTAIWESTRETQAPGWGGGAAAGGNVFADKDPNTWNMPPKPSMDGSNWGSGGNNPMGNNPMNNPMGNNPMVNNPMVNNPMVNNPMGNNPMSDKSIGTWGGESQQSNKLWGAKTETGSWNEPPQQRSNMTWGGQDTDVGTWEDPASAASRRIVSSSGAGPVNMGGSGSGMSMGSGNMSVGGGNMGMGGGNMGMGGGNMGMGGGNMGMGGGNMGMGGGNMGMGGGNGMGSSGMNMPMGGVGSGMNMGGGSGMVGGNMNMTMGGGGNMNMPMGGGNGMNVGSGNGMNVGSDSMFWNDPNSKPQGWNPATGPPRPKPDEPWNKQGMGRPGGNNGWGDPSGSSSQKADDGTSIWAANAQEQVSCWFVN